jgi:hypothetical protein
LQEVEMAVEEAVEMVQISESLVLLKRRLGGKEITRIEKTP